MGAGLRLQAAAISVVVMERKSGEKMSRKPSLVFCEALTGGGLVKMNLRSRCVSLLCIEDSL